MKRAIVIGASGFLGSSLVQELSSKGYEVYALQHKKVPGTASDVRLIRGGITGLRREFIDELRPDVIFHCARPTFSRFRRAGRIAAAWLAARLNRQLLENLRTSEQKPLLVFASGSLMYGNSPTPHDELSPLKPVSYARQYYRGETPWLETIEDNSYPVMMLRLPWLLGNGSWFRWFYLDKIRKHSAIPAFGDMQNKMEIIGVDEAAKMMRKYSVEMRSTGIFNIPSARPLSQEEFVNAVAGAYRVRIEDHKKLFPGKMEKEALEAFTSNITLKTLYPEVVEEFPYKTVEELAAMSGEQLTSSV